VILGYEVWLDAFSSGLNAEDQGRTLGKALANLIDEYGSLGTELHLIGHSHGGGVVGQAAKIMSQLGYPATSLTTLDTPRVPPEPWPALVNTLRNVDPASVERAAVFYYDLLPCIGVGGPSLAGATNVKLNCAHVPPLPDIAHLWVTGPNDGTCPTTEGWCPPAIWDAAGGHAGSVFFDGQAKSLLEPTSFPAGQFEEGDLYEFQTARDFRPIRSRDGDITTHMSLRLVDVFEAANTWTGTNALVVTGADPDDPNNTVVLLQEVGEVSFYKDIAWPVDALVMTFDYMFLEPRGGESLTVYVGDQIVFYDSADTTLAIGHLTRTGPAFVGSAAGTDARLDFVLRTDGTPGGAVVLDNVRVHAVRRGDLDGNGIVGWEDFEDFAGCLTGPDVAPPEGCPDADITLDDDVDLLDLAAFQREYGVSR
jgi:hypothetical protein